MAVTVSDRLLTVGRGRDREGLMPAIAGRDRDPAATLVGSRRHKLLESVIALMAFHKYPVPNESTLVKRVKDFYTTRRSTSLIKADPERRKQRRVALKRSRLTHAARDKVVKDAIESGELTADDKESIEKLRSSVAMVPLSDVDVASDEEEERATFEKQRLLHLSRARAVRAAHRSEELV
eukprot:Em0019g965a